MRITHYAPAMTATAPTFAELDLATTPVCLRISGHWTLAHYATLEHTLLGLRGRVNAQTRIDLDGVDTLDTAGAALLADLLGATRLHDLAHETARWPPARRGWSTCRPQTPTATRMARRSTRAMCETRPPDS